MRLVYLFFVVVFLLPINTSFSAEVPTFENRLLTIPTVNTPVQLGRFQDISFELTAQGVWRLLDAKVVGSQGLGLEAIIDGVELVETGSFPVQVLLRVTGYFSDGCPSIGQINHRLEENHFDVVIYSTRPVGKIACTQAIEPFRRTIPLPTYGLVAGSYSYSINGENSGNFVLATDNELAGDCDGNSECTDVELSF